MKPQLPIPNKDFRRDKILKIVLVRVPNSLTYG